MQVALISYTPDSELVVATAARVSSSPASVAEFRERLTPDRITKLLNHLLTSGHMFPFEHASFTFAIEGISRVTRHQLVRYRVASYTQQSQRYVSLKGLRYITPATIASRAALKARYQEMLEAAHKLYLEMQEAGVPAEDARYVLPSAVETRLVMTMNGRELIHANSLRMCLREQWEIVQLFGLTKSEVERVAPHIGGQMRPKCYQLGYCD